METLHVDSRCMFNRSGLSSPLKHTLNDACREARASKHKSSAPFATHMAANGESANSQKSCMLAAFLCDAVAVAACVASAIRCDAVDENVRGAWNPSALCPKRRRCNTTSQEQSQDSAGQRTKQPPLHDGRGLPHGRMVMFAWQATRCMRTSSEAPSQQRSGLPPLSMQQCTSCSW